MCLRMLYVAMTVVCLGSGKLWGIIISSLYKFYVFYSAQSGQWTYAKEFSKLALEIEQDELGARADRMADLYYLQAKVKDEVNILL